MIDSSVVTNWRFEKEKKKIIRQLMTGGVDARLGFLPTWTFIPHQPEWMMVESLFKSFGIAHTPPPHATNGWPEKTDDSNPSQQLSKQNAGGKGVCLWAHGNLSNAVSLDRLRKHIYIFVQSNKRFE